MVQYELLKPACSPRAVSSISVATLVANILIFEVIFFIQTTINEKK